MKLHGIIEQTPDLRIIYKAGVSILQSYTNFANLFAIASAGSNGTGAASTSSGISIISSFSKNLP